MLQVAAQRKRWNGKNPLSIKPWPVTRWPCSRGYSVTANWMFKGISLVLPTKESNPLISTKRLGAERGSVELLVKRGTTTELAVALWPRPGRMIGAPSGHRSHLGRSRRRLGESNFSSTWACEHFVHARTLLPCTSEYSG
jgi:hypothetical protein